MTKDNIFLSVSIIISGVLIAGAVIWSNSGNVGVRENEGSAGVSLRPVTAEDHILGSIDAPVKVVEYSDLECPFCARIHPSLTQIKEEYGDDVAWVYRHFPLESIHPRARGAAIASECVAELGGNSAFWSFLNVIFSDQQGALSNIAGTAASVGVDAAEFDACITSGRHNASVDSDLADAEQSGGQGTPWTVVIGRDGTTYPINGAVPYAQIKAVVEEALK